MVNWSGWMFCLSQVSAISRLANSTVSRGATIQPTTYRLKTSKKQSSHFFLNVDDDFRFTQFFAEVLILATQLLVFFVQGAALGLGATLLWCQGMQDSRGTLVPP